MLWSVWTTCGDDLASGQLVGTIWSVWATGRDDLHGLDGLWERSGASGLTHEMFAGWYMDRGASGQLVGTIWSVWAACGDDLERLDAPDRSGSQYYYAPDRS